MARKYGTTVYVNAKWRMMLRLKGTVILQIWWHILLVGIYSTIVFLISKYTEWKMLYTLVIFTTHSSPHGSITSLFPYYQRPMHVCVLPSSSSPCSRARLELKVSVPAIFRFY